MEKRNVKNYLNLIIILFTSILSDQFIFKLMIHNVKRVLWRNNCYKYIFKYIKINLSINAYFCLFIQNHFGYRPHD